MEEILPTPISYFPRENISYLSWPLYDKLRTETFIKIPLLFFHPLKIYSKAAWYT